MELKEKRRKKKIFEAFSFSLVSLKSVENETNNEKVALFLHIVFLLCLCSTLSHLSLIVIGFSIVINCAILCFSNVKISRKLTLTGVCF